MGGKKSKSGTSRRHFLKTAGAGTAFAMAATASANLRADEQSQNNDEKPSKAKLPQRPLGKTGVEVPILGLGSAPAGHRPRKEAAEFYSDCLDAGVTYLDTAPELAGYGGAQLALGDVLKSRRREAFLVTKCWEPDGEAALKLLKENLRELQTDHADLVYAHSLGSDKMDPKTVLGARGVMRALEKAQRDGLTRFVGISGHNRPRRFLDVLREFDVAVMMNAVNFVSRHVYNFEEIVWPEAHRRGVALVAMKVFGGGIEPGGGRIKPPDTLQAFRYAQSLPNISTVVLGMREKAELEENARFARTYTPLSKNEMNRLLARGKQLAAEWGESFGPVT